MIQSGANRDICPGGTEIPRGGGDGYIREGVIVTPSPSDLSLHSKQRRRRKEVIKIKCFDAIIANSWL